MAVGLHPGLTCGLHPTLSFDCGLSNVAVLATTIDSHITCRLCYKKIVGALEFAKKWRPKRQNHHNSASLNSLFEMEPFVVHSMVGFLTGGEAASCDPNVELAFTP